MTTSFKERRVSVQSMSEPQYREFMMQQLEAGRLTMVALQAAVEETRGMIAENTRITQQNVDQTAAVVSIITFSETSARKIVKIGRFFSVAARIILPIVILYGTILGIMHGKFPSWKDLIP
jgi:RecB family endonuclease NucS